MVNGNFLIYSLIDADVMFYIGMTTKGMIRPLLHFEHAKQGRAVNKRMLEKMQSLFLENRSYEIQIIESGFETKDDLEKAEIFWISYFRSIGCPLLNSADGGRGSRGSRWKCSIEQKAEYSARAKICQSKQETRDRKSLSESTTRLLPHNRERFSRIAKECQNRPDVRAKHLKRAKPVICVTDGIEYDSMNEASRNTGLSAQYIRYVCNGLWGSYKGKKWIWK